MKPFTNGDSFKTPLIFKITAFVVISVTFFYFGKHWSDGYRQLIFFSTSRDNPGVSLSPNYNKDLNVSTLINQNQTEALSEKTILLVSAPSPSLIFTPPPPPTPMLVQRFGIVDENGTMSYDFEIGDFDPNYVENWGNSSEADISANSLLNCSVPLTWPFKSRC